MTNLYDHNRANEEDSPSMSRTAEDNLSNSDGPLLLSKKRDVDVHRNQMHSSSNNWHKRCDTYYPEKKSNRCLWMLTGFLAFIGFCNLLLNLTIMVVLRVSQGMEALEVIPERHLLKFYGNTDLDRVCVQKGLCEGFGDEPMELRGNAGGVQIQVKDRYHNTLSSAQILENETVVFQVHESFEVKDPRSGSIFSTDKPTFGLPESVRKVEADLIKTHRIAAPKRSDLSIDSSKNLDLEGAEGVTSDSKTIDWSSVNDIVLHSRNGDIVIDAKDSINLPAVPFSSDKSVELKEQYKVCVCMPDGKLFLIPAHNKDAMASCARLSRSLKNNPCA